ncbi:MAG TPA: prepilin-type N-terminal cleavage/methylation domain-containing protein [Albitalea sp.]|nr:prepilin-type N-terminal cleavage/methylation domain-containing protein [Albitalea sp.]
MTFRSRGFTLIELLVVITLIAIASGLASLALRDPTANQLEQEGARLAALLESARAEARASGLAVRWVPRSSGASGPEDFRFVGLSPATALPQRWLSEGVTADIVGARAIVLGPEPLIPAQRIVLSLEDRRLTLVTDGLGPFEVATP